MNRKLKILLIAGPLGLLVIAICLAPMIVYTLVEPAQTISESSRLRNELRGSPKIDPGNYTPAPTRDPSPETTLNPELNLDYGVLQPETDSKVEGEVTPVPHRVDELGENAAQHTARYLTRETDDLKLNSRPLDDRPDFKVGVALDKEDGYNVRGVENSRGNRSATGEEKAEGLKLKDF